MVVTKQIAAQKLTAFLRSEALLAQLVDRAETVLLHGEFHDQDTEALRFVIAGPASPTSVRLASLGRTASISPAGLA